MDEKHTALKALRIKLDLLSREQKSIPLTLANCERKQAIQDEMNRLDAEFTAISRTIRTH